MKKWKKCLALFMSAAVLFTGGMLPQKNAATAERAADYGISSPRIENGVTTWDKIKFGSYYQDGEAQPAEPIKWRVLSVNGNDAFLLADRCLDAKAYENTGYESVWDAWSQTDDKYSAPWEMCSLRKWLNEDFYNEAFDDDEKNAISETAVINDFNGKNYNTTYDKVYLLSVEEVHNEAYGFEPFNTEDEEESGNDESKTREAKDTDYAKINSTTGEYGAMLATTNGYWWLRSSGYHSEDNSRRNPNPNEGLEYAYACQVGFTGQCLGFNGIGLGYVGDSGRSVRPALHVNLSSPKVKAAGKVDSEGNVTMSDGGINNPVVKDGVTTWDCVYLGNYKQDFSVKQAIEWRVLSVDGDDAFLLADKNLIGQPYDEDYRGVKSITWENCSLRKWLNECFYNESFDDEEKNAVRETMVNNDDNPEYGTDGGVDTIDKVYLLSIAEASNSAYGFDTEFEKSSYTRMVENTDYARANDASRNEAGNSAWRLRSPGIRSDMAAFVDCDGSGFYPGESNGFSLYSIRPALHINLSSSSWSKAGQVTAERGSDDTPTDEPTASPEPTKEPSPTDKPTASTKPGQTTAPTVTAQPTLPPAETQNPVQTPTPVLKQLKLTSVKCARNAKKITGKVSVSKASVKIKVDKKAYKKAAVKGKKFTLKLNYKLKKKTKVIIKAEKKGYKSLVKSYTVK